MRKLIMTLAAFFAVLFVWNCDLKVEAYPKNMLDGYMFDATYYAQTYPEIAFVVGIDEAALYNHYKTVGYKEGRFPYEPGTTMSVLNENFDAAYYAVYNPDVVAALGNMPMILFNHYVTFGMDENRKTHGANGIVMPKVTRWDYPQAALVLDTIGWDMRTGYDWLVKTYTYYGHGKPDMPEEGSNGTKWFAEFGFTNLKGNCFVFAASFYEMAKLMGYEPRQMEGKLPLRGGGYGPHSWDEIDIDGVTYVFDPECTWAVGKDAFKVQYGAPGTWRYCFYTQMHE